MEIKDLVKNLKFAKQQYDATTGSGIGREAAKTRLLNIMFSEADDIISGLEAAAGIDELKAELELKEAEIQDYASGRTKKSAAKVTLG